MSISLDLTKRQGLPDALRVLAEAYPRADWQAHANFGDMVQFWMQRHAMFRQLVDLLRGDARALISNDLSFEDYAPRLSHYGGTLLNELHSHHNIEDHHYFPRLITLDPRLERGFDLLEKDHAAMDGLLHGFATGANAVLRSEGDVGAFYDQIEAFAGLLERHLTDEEDIIVPVILHSGFTG